MNSQLTSSYIVLRIIVNVFSLAAFASVAQADIFQWEYINPADPSQGKQQSTTLAPDGAGVDAVPGAQLYYRDLTMAYLIGTDLRDASAVETNLTDADLRQSNLTNANFLAATLTDADFAGASVRGATFDQVRYGGLGGAWVGTGLTLAQLYSTASYQARDLSGIGLCQNNLVSGDLRGQNLTNANFVGATLTDADFTDAEIAGASFDKDYYVYAPSAGTGITLAQLYSTANYKKRDLTGVGFWYHDFTGGNFAGQELAQADFYAATLTDADFTGADVRRADFGIYFNFHPLIGYQIRGTGLTLEQLYSTASYKSLDLSGVRLAYNNLAGGNFAGQNLTNANFFGATLTDADFTGAEVRGASFGRLVLRTTNVSKGGMTLAQLYSTASYKAKDLTGVQLSSNQLSGGNFVGQNLTNADFYGATLTDADFTGAQIHGADFSIPSYSGAYAFGTLITLAQLYSTESYQNHDLSGISLSGNNLSGANFASQNLSNAHFTGARLTDADFTDAEIRGAWFHRGDFGTGLSLLQLYSTASYQAKDLRGIQGLDVWAGMTTNLILPNGHIGGLNLDGGSSLLLRDFDGDSRYSSTPPIPITIDQHFAMAPGGTLRMVFEADAWDSTISFAPGIPVTLGGTLELTFDADVNLASQVGRTFDLFDWTGVTPTGTFTVSGPYAWDRTNLYTTGEVRLTAVPEPHALFLLGFAVTALVAVGRLRLRFFESVKGENP